jgi:NADP-dependent 3-hydroxy acid dehydrogenase YdfG
MAAFESHPSRRPAFITGASSGIGAAVAQALAAAGHPVALAARRVERCEELAAAIRADGGEAIAVELDLHDDEAVAAAASAATKALGDIEIIVSNAGDVRPVTAAGAEPDEFLRQISVNLLGPQLIIHALAPSLIERGRGDVVFVTSEVARSPRPQMAAYVAAKSGLEGLAAAMMMELEGSGVRVGIVRPGPSATEQGMTWSEDEINTTLDSWKKWGVMRHSGYLQPGDVAAAVLAMVSVPRGAHFTMIEVQPEAPVRKAKP